MYIEGNLILINLFVKVPGIPENMNKVHVDLLSVTLNPNTKEHITTGIFMHEKVDMYTLFREIF